MQLYEYAIILEEKRDKNDKIVDKAQLIERGDLLAADMDQANLLAGRKIPERLMEELERVTLAVRPF